MKWFKECQGHTRTDTLMIATNSVTRFSIWSVTGTLIYWADIDEYDYNSSVDIYRRLEITKDS